MKTKLIQCAIAPLALLLSSAALAAETPSAELKIIGTIVPEPCIMTLANGGLIDFGNIPASLVQPDRTTLLSSPPDENLTITCPASTTVAFQVNENRAGTSSSINSIYGFGLGNVNSEGKLGYYFVRLRNMTQDGAPSYISNRVGSTGDFTHAENADKRVSATPNSQYAWTDSSRQPRAGLTFSTDMYFSVVLASVEQMNGPVTEEVALDGSLTLTLITGL